MASYYERTQQVETDAEGRRLYGELWRRRAEHYDELSPTELADIDSAMHELELADPSLKKERDRWQRRQNREGEKHLRQEERVKAAGPRARGAAKRPARSGGSARRGGRSPAARPSSRSSRSRGSSAFRRTGIPGAATSTTGTLLALAGGTIGLTALFLVLRNQESAGGRVVDQIFGGLAGGLERVIAPVDPLAPRAPAPARQGARPRSPNPLVNPLAAGPIDPRQVGRLPRGRLPNLTTQLAKGTR